MNLQQAQVIKAIPFVKNQQLEESKQKPLANSLQLFDKVDIFNQISIRRKSIIPSEEVDKIIDKVTIPDVQNLFNKSEQDLKNLTIRKAHWDARIETLGFTLRDGEFCKAGTKFDFSYSHTFDPAKKINAIESIMS